MTRYITVKLTEDQARLVQTMIDERFELLRGWTGEDIKEEAAFLRRLQSKLAQAKS